MLRVAAAAGKPFQGLAIAGRELRMSSGWQRRLRNLDACYGMARMRTLQRIKEFIQALDGELRASGDGAEARKVRAPAAPDAWSEPPAYAERRQEGAAVKGGGWVGDHREGEDVFRERRSIIFKTLRLKRIFDKENNVLIYISHARDVQNGSAKMSMSTIPLYQPGQ